MMERLSIAMKFIENPFPTQNSVLTPQNLQRIKTILSLELSLRQPYKSDSMFSQSKWL